MTHSRSAEKRVRQAEAARVRNRSVRAATRTQIRKSTPLMAEGRVEEAEATVRQAESALDKAAQKGVIHPNNAARRKSRMMRKLSVAAKVAAQAAAAAPEAKPARRGAKKEAAPKASAPAKKTSTRKAPTKKTTGKSKS